MNRMDMLGGLQAKTLTLDLWRHETNFDNDEKVLKWLKSGKEAKYGKFCFDNLRNTKLFHNILYSSYLSKISIEIGKYSKRSQLKLLFRVISKKCFVKFNFFQLNKNIFVGLEDELVKKPKVKLEFNLMKHNTFMYFSIIKWFGELNSSLYSHVTWIGLKFFQTGDVITNCLQKETKIKNFFSNLFKNCKVKNFLDKLMNEFGTDLKYKFKIIEVYESYVKNLDSSLLLLLRSTTYGIRPENLRGTIYSDDVSDSEWPESE